MVLLIDNYDSFSYNLYQAIGATNPDIKVIRNDELTVEDIRALNPDCIVLSPGPGKPCDAGVCVDVVKGLHKEVPILGICLGHQAIFEAFGGTVSYAKELMHGKSSKATIDVKNSIFDGLFVSIKIARYHSLAGVKSTLPEELRVIAQTDDGEVMAVAHREYPVYGLQFHPESILTPDGGRIVENFLAKC